MKLLGSRPRSNRLSVVLPLEEQPDIPMIIALRFSEEAALEAAITTYCKTPHVTAGLRRLEKLRSGQTAD